MNFGNHQNLIAILQASLTPVVLISGVGLLLLSMTNRIARPLDRIRFLGKELKTASKPDQTFYLRQIEILYTRCFLLQKAIFAAVISIISTSIIILLIFFMTIYSFNLYFVVDFVFIVGLLALIISLFYFMCDIQASLKSVQIEMNRLKTNYPDINVKWNNIRSIENKLIKCQISIACQIDYANLVAPIN